MPFPSCHCRAISWLAAMRPNPLIQSIAKFRRIINWFILVGKAFCFCAMFWSSLICSRSSGHPRISSLALTCSASSASSSRNCLISSSSSSESPPADSSWEPSASSSYKEPHGGGEAEGADRPGDGAPDCTLDGATDGALDTAIDGAMDGALNAAEDGTLNAAEDGALDAALDNAGDEEADVEIERSWDGVLVNINWVSFP